MKYTIPVVGAHFRPPAKALLASAQAGLPLTLEREPTNQYDEFAIKVLLDVADFSEASKMELRDQLLEFGYEIEDLEGSLTHVGYIASKQPKGQSWEHLAPDVAPRLDMLLNLQQLAESEDEVEGTAWPTATLQFSPSGGPVAVFEL